MSLYDRRLNDYYRNKEKSQTTRFTDLVVGHTFEIVEVDKTPKGHTAKCALCGQYMKYFVLIKRDDRIVKVKVGRTCLVRAGLELRKEDKEKFKTLSQPCLRQENTKDAGKTEQDGSNDDLLRMLDEM